MTVATVPTVITEPGLYDGLPEDQYHLDPVPGGSLSSTGARELLTCAAKFAWTQEHGRPERTTFDIGRAVHGLVLGTGPELVEVKAANWRTDLAKNAKAAAYARGAVPLLTSDMEVIREIAAAFQAHPAAALLTEDGRPERSLFWVDDETGVWCRARLDWSNGLTTVDLKTADDASPEHFAKDIANYGYHVQYALYLRGIRALGLAGPREPEWVWAVVEKTRPYLIGTYAPHPDDLAIGDELVSRALRKFAEGQRTGYWPGYPAGITTIRLPRWATYLPEDFA